MLLSAHRIEAEQYCESHKRDNKQFKLKLMIKKKEKLPLNQNNIPLNSKISHI